MTLSQADPQNPTILICTPSLSGSARAASNSATTPPPLLPLSFLLLGPLFFWFARDVTRKELADFVGQKVG